MDRKMEQCLTSFIEGWEEMFRYLKEYKEAHDGDCNVPEGYEVDGVNLGAWVQSQRKCRKAGNMDPERERRLEDLGLWDFGDDWEERFELLTEYKETHGHCNLPWEYTVNDIKLGRWVEAQRRRHNEGKMDAGHEWRLRELGVSWQPLQDKWEERLRLLAEYKEAHGHCNVPETYDVEGIKLGVWVRNQRRRYKQGKMDPDRERQLEEMGFRWDFRDDEADWKERFELLEEYKEAHGHCNVPQSYEVEGIKLGLWVKSQRTRYKEGKMDPDRERRLEDLGLRDLDDDWEERFELLTEYKETRGHCNLPWEYTVNDIKLGRWVEAQRRRHDEGKMVAGHEWRLRELGVSWQPLQDKWEERLRLLAEYKEAHGHCNVPGKYEVEGIKLGVWVKNQRKHYKQGKMDPERERQLKEMGFRWDFWEDDETMWEERFELLEEYKEAHGHCNVPQSYDVDGIKLGLWVKSQRTRYKEGKMDPDREQQLEDLGFCFQRRKERGASLHGRQ